jgi:hypothetical protein
MMSAMESVLGNTCEIILEGLIGVMTMMERRKERSEVGNICNYNFFFIYRPLWVQFKGSLIE